MEYEFWVLQWWHQAAYEWQEKEVCSGLAYSTQHMTCEDRYIALKEEVLGLEDVSFQLQYREALSPRHNQQQLEPSPSLGLNFISQQTRVGTQLPEFKDIVL
jgi:hypothetical protein